VVVDELEHEAEIFTKKSMAFILHIFKLDHKDKAGFLKGLRRPLVTSALLYIKLKEREGQLLKFYGRLQGAGLSTEQFTFASQCTVAVRYCIRAAKSMKDIDHDLKEFRESANDMIHSQYLAFRNDWKEFDAALQNIVASPDHKSSVPELMELMRTAFQSQQKFTAQTVESLRKKLLTEIETSTLMNVQYEILSAKKSLVRAIAHLRLTDTQADDFEFLPGS
jgi:hypothetical protein